MPRSVGPSIEKTNEERILNLEKQVEELVLFAKNLIDRLAKTEKEKVFADEQIYFLPEGKYFGKNIE